MTPEPSETSRYREPLLEPSRERCFAVAIPAYQAAAAVADVVRRARWQATEVLVVDDGSCDGTADAARQAGARVISFPENHGKGCALAAAFADLFGRGYAAVVTIDADGQHLPEEVPRLLAAWRDSAADLVVGDRGHLFRGMSRLRRNSNRASSVVISSVAGQRFADVQSGFRLYTRRLIDAVGFPEPRFEAESAVIVRAVRSGLRVVTVPVELGFADGRLTSHYRPLVDSLRIARAVTAARMQLSGWTRKTSS